ncbi:hypothetical protein WK94_14380 [Burkholderia ubonensis]|nr:hypothetical protein WK66_26390 [Burkholderia ubonensis]KVW22173.1 hypothetical protein WK94_14380 [Burkholderia ubonensis]
MCLPVNGIALEVQPWQFPTLVLVGSETVATCQFLKIDASSKRFPHRRCSCVITDDQNTRLVFFGSQFRDTGIVTCSEFRLPDWGSVDVIAKVMFDFRIDFCGSHRLLHFREQVVALGFCLLANKFALDQLPLDHLP